MIIWMLFSIVISYCLCCCEVLGPQLFFDFTLGLKKKDLNHWMSSSCAVGFQQVVRTRMNPSLKSALWKAYKQVDLNKDCSQTKTETHSRDQSTGWYLYSRWSLKCNNCIEGHGRYVTIKNPTVARRNVITSFFFSELLSPSVVSVSGQTVLVK